MQRANRPDKHPIALRIAEIAENDNAGEKRGNNEDAVLDAECFILFLLTYMLIIYFHALKSFRQALY